MARPWAYIPQPWDSRALNDFLVGEGALQTEGDEFDVNILFRNDSDVIEVKPLRISIDHDQGLIMAGEESISFSQIRFITTKRNLMTISDSDVITFSYRAATRDDVNKKTRLVYMQATSADQVGKIMNKFRQLQFQPLEAIEDVSITRMVFTAFVPEFIDRINVEVTDVRSDRVDEHKQFIVSLDQECMCLFSRSFSTMPDYQVNFWKEEGENSVDKCAVIHATQQFEIVTASYIYRLKKEAAVDQLVKHITKIKPRPRNHFFEPVLLVRTQEPFKEKWEEGPSQVGPGPGPDQFQYRRDTDVAVNESRRIFLRSFKDKLENAFQRGETNMDWQAIWAPNDQAIKELLENPELLPKRDARSGGCDPDSIDHFTACTDDIVDKMFCQECVDAFASLKNLREIFSECSYAEMGYILADDDYTLLKKLLFKTMYDQTV